MSGQQLPGEPPILAGDEVEETFSNSFNTMTATVVMRKGEVRRPNLSDVDTCQDRRAYGLEHFEATLRRALHEPLTHKLCDTLGSQAACFQQKGVGHGLVGGRDGQQPLEIQFAQPTHDQSGQISLCDVDFRGHGGQPQEEGAAPSRTKYRFEPLPEAPAEIRELMGGTPIDPLQALDPEWYPFGRDKRRFLAQKQ